MPGELRSSPSYLAKLSVELFSNRLKLSYSDIGLFVDYQETEGESLTDASLHFSPRIFSAQLSLENLVLTGEYALRKFEFNNFGPALPTEQTGESYYLQYVYLINRNIRMIGRYDVAYLNRDDKDGLNIEQLSGGERPAYTQFAKDLSIGFQWFIGKSWLIMLEQHRISGTAWLPILDNPDPSTQQKNWWMFSGLVSYRF
jgi:hypothetical protein